MNYWEGKVSQSHRGHIFYYYESKLMAVRIGPWKLQTRQFAKSISRARHPSRTGLKRFLPWLFGRLLRRSGARSKQCGYCWRPESHPSLGSCR